MAISEVILVMLDVDLVNFSKFGKNFAKIKLKNRFFELARLKKSLKKYANSKKNEET